MPLAGVVELAMCGSKYAVSQKQLDRAVELEPAVVACSPHERHAVLSVAPAVGL